MTWAIERVKSRSAQARVAADLLGGLFMITDADNGRLQGLAYGQDIHVWAQGFLAPQLPQPTKEIEGGGHRG